MGPKRRDVTEAELAILQILWNRGLVTARQLTDSLYPDGSFSDYTTVKKLLARLEEKGHVDRDARGRAHVFRAKTSRDALLSRRLQALADELCQGSRRPLLMSLLGDQPLTEEEREELQDFLDGQFDHSDSKRD